MRVTGINRYPVKSCRGEAVQSAVVEPWGLAGDRRWMLVDEDAEAVTAREVHRMLLLRPELVPGGLTVAAADQPLLAVPRPTGNAVTVTVHGKPLRAMPAGPGADAWFRTALGRPARLVFLDDPTCRPTNPAFSLPGDRVSFADGYPVLVTTQESLAALNDLVADTGPGAHQPLPMTRFRPNLVVAGAPAWAEDDWRRVRIGEAVFRLVKGCDRCVMTTVDPDTAAGGKEPIATLARHRRWDGKTWFGVNAVPDTPGATIRVGDEVELLEAEEPGGGPVRAAGPVSPRSGVPTG